MEKSYTDYIRQARSLVTEENIRLSLDTGKTLGHFSLPEGGSWQAADYRGYTLITPPFPEDKENQNTYEVLSDVQKCLGEFINPRKIVAVPDQALHMTVARLVSGEVYKHKLAGTRDEGFLTAMTLALAGLTIPGKLRFEVSGISVYPSGVIVAVVAPASEQDYERLQKLRDHIYADKELQELGVERRRGFSGHITLYYIEAELAADEKAALAAAIAAVNQAFFAEPLPFTLQRAEVRGFDNFFGFYRQESWPTFEFA